MLKIFFGLMLCHFVTQASTLDKVNFAYNAFSTHDDIQKYWISRCQQEKNRQANMMVISRHHKDLLKKIKNNLSASTKKVAQCQKDLEHAVKAFNKERKIKKMKSYYKLIINQKHIIK